MNLSLQRKNLNRIDSFLMIPASLFAEEPYRSLPSESKLLYGRLLGLLRLSAQDTTGHWKAGHRPCVSLSQASVGRMLHCPPGEGSRAVCRAGSLRIVAAGAGAAKRQGTAVLHEFAPPQGAE